MGTGFSGGSSTVSNRRTATLHAGGRCELRCVLCDCRAVPSTDTEIDRVLQSGGRQLLLRGATERSRRVASLIERGRQAGFAEIVLRSNAMAAADPISAAEFSRLGGDAVLVPVFSHQAAVHDRVAGRLGALQATLSGMAQLASNGMAVEIEVPILPLRLQNLFETVYRTHEATPLRRVRFYLPHVVPPVLAPSPWDPAGTAFARALQFCREQHIQVQLTTPDAIPLCALHDFPDLHDAYAFNPKSRKLRLRDAVFLEECSRCVVRPQCPGVVPAYAQALGARGLRAYLKRPVDMYAQRTTRRRVWTAEQRRAASRAEILVLRPTVNCNQDCTFCSANETSANVWADHREMLRAIARAAQRGIERVSFSGGEPTLSRHLSEYVRCASRLGIPKIELVSNAVLLDKPQKVKSLADAGLTHAFISLHAHDEALSRRMTQKAGDFERTVRGIHNLLDAGIRTSTNHVITAQNYPYLIRYVEFLHREFGGRVNISFAFVTPQFKALDNLSVMPRLSDVMPHLKRALYRALEIRQSFGIGSRQGIPFCFLDEFRAWSDGIKLSNSAISEDGPQKQRAAGCDECRFSDYCTGLWRPYVARYGLDEIRPIPGPKLTDAEVEEWMLRTREFEWGDPPSFDRITPAIRAPELELGPPDIAAVPAELADFSPHRSRPLRIALLGTGRQARRLARNLREVGGLSIDAVASPHAPEADLADFGGCPAFSQASEAVEEVRPEAIIIAAATAAHFELAKMAIDRGLPSLLEKPVASNEAEAVALAEAARAAGALVVPAHNSIYAAGLDEIFGLPFERKSISYLWRRTPASPDSIRTWNRSSLYETLYHVVAVVARAAGGGVGVVRRVSFRGEAFPEQLRVQLGYGAHDAEILLDFLASAEEDILTVEDRAVHSSGRVWRREGRRTTLQDSSGVRVIEPRGNDVQCMLANFRDVLLGLATPGCTLDDAIGIMRTARSIVEALEESGAPFDRLGGPRHVASPSVQTALR